MIDRQPNKCKAPWCGAGFIATQWTPDGYCSALHRSMHEAQKFDDELTAELDRYAGKAFELEEKVEALTAERNRLNEANEEYRRAIFNLYNVLGLGPVQQGAATWALYKLAGIGNKHD